MDLTPFSLIFLSLTQLLFLLPSPTFSQTPSAPAPGPSGPINVTDIFVKGGQYTTFLLLLNKTRMLDQITNQLNSSTVGMTVFAPTDNAFLNLPAGTLNKLSDNQHVQLVQFHVLPKYYSLADLLTVSNPVRTQATGQDGGVFALNFTGHANQVNVSSGIVETQVNNALRQQFPFAVYQIDKVLLPVEFTQAKPSAGSPPPEASGKTPASGGLNSTRPSAEGPTPVGNGSGKMNAGLGLGLVAGVWLVCMALL